MDKSTDKTWEKQIADLIELAKEAGEFAFWRKPREDCATLVTLSGELGAGKTTFTKAAAVALGIEDVVTSPTFVLEKIYQLPPGSAFKQLIHIDAYRLESSAELAPLKLDELMKDPMNLIMLEWPEKVADALPPADVKIAIKVLGPDARTLTYTAPV